MFELIPEEILNVFSLRVKRDAMKDKLNHPRTPKKYHAALQKEIERLDALYQARLQQEQTTKTMR